MSVRVRFPPSPTGFLHIGGLRTALYNELFARKHGGQLILRIEDTDRARMVEGSADSLIQTLKTMNIVPDEGPFIQSERRETHIAHAHKLVELGKAYPCFCTPEDLDQMRKNQMSAGLPPRYNRKCRPLDPAEAKSKIQQGIPYVVRLAIPESGSVTFADEIRGSITYDWKEIDDAVILKSDGWPTYHLAATTDDHEMKITHVIRGEEWIPSTPKHIFIYEAFEWDIPKFAHLPLLLGADKKKLSKRQNDVAVEDFLKDGYVPEALLNFVALLGWNPTADREIYSHDELRKLFDLKSVHKGGAIVNVEKLDWMNGEYLRAMPEEEYLTLAESYVKNKRLALHLRDRISKLTELPEQANPYESPTVDLDPEILPWKTQSPEEAKQMLIEVRALLKDQTAGIWNSLDLMEEALKDFISINNYANGDVLWPLRAALSGAAKSPPPFDMLYVLGREKSMKRIDSAITLLD